MDRDFIFDTICSNPIVEKFCNEAYVLHDYTVNQKYGEDDSLPYSYHLKSVVDFAKTYVRLVAEDPTDVLPILFAVAFHDSIEDARLTYNDVMKIAEQHLIDKRSATIATEIVYALTNEKGKTRSERANDKYYEGIRTTKYAPFVKMCDRLANMKYSASCKSSMMSKYYAELPHFLESIVESSNSKKSFNVPAEMINLAKQIK